MCIEFRSKRHRMGAGETAAGDSVPREQALAACRVMSPAYRPVLLAGEGWPSALASVIAADSLNRVGTVNLHNVFLGEGA